ncbi:alpha,alpha-phosphotrehalase, partial [Vibrio sp. 10N.222.52.B7]
IMVNRDGVTHQDMMAILAQKSRDNSRTPMQWNSEPYAGFSLSQPWLDVANNYTEINAEQALEDKDSVF